MFMKETWLRETMNWPLVVLLYVTLNLREYVLTLKANNFCLPESYSNTLHWKFSYIITIFTIPIFAGYLIFIIFGGTGLVALPWDLVASIFTKSRSITEQEWGPGPLGLLNVFRFKKNQEDISEKVKKLIEKGEGYAKEVKSRKELFNWKKVSPLTLCVAWQKIKKVYDLEEEFENNAIAYKLQGGPPVWYWAKLGAGIFLCVTRAHCRWLTLDQGRWYLYSG